MTPYEALKPFADFADPRHRVPPAQIITNGSSMGKRQLRMSDCYRALDAITESREDEAFLPLFEQWADLMLISQPDREILRRTVATVPDEREALRARVAELEALINNPETDDFMRAVPLEAAHQVERWGSTSDAGKAPNDWFWLIGYLAGKCLVACMTGDKEKAKHHCVSTAAAMLNWHRAITGEDNRMAPGVDR